MGYPDCFFPSPWSFSLALLIPPCCLCLCTAVVAAVYCTGTYFVPSGSRGLLVDLVGRAHEERLTWSAPPQAVRLSTAFFVAAVAQQVIRLFLEAVKSLRESLVQTLNSLVIRWQSTPKRVLCCGIHTTPYRTPASLYTARRVPRFDRWKCMTWPPWLPCRRSTLWEPLAWRPVP